MRLLFWCDLHIAERPPLARSESYVEDLFAKLEELKELAGSCDLTIMGGDWLHWPRPNDTSHRLVRRLIECLRDWPTTMYTVIGNHDLGPEGMESLPRMPLGVILEALKDGPVQLLDEPVVIENELMLWPVNWRHDIDRRPELYTAVKPKPTGPAAWLVEVTHGMVMPPGGGWPFDCVAMDQIETEADVVLIGHCVAYDTPVQLDQGHRAIGSLVNSRAKCEVLSLDSRGEIVARPVTNWFRSGLGRRRWVGLKRKWSRAWRQGSKATIWVTDDHPVLGPDGWRSAGTLCTGDIVATDEYAPNATQQSVVVGSLLGDGYLAEKHYGRARHEFSHGSAQAGWAELKGESLGMRRRATDVLGRVRYASETGAFWASLVDRWYIARRGRKILASNLTAAELTPLALAVWYADDGTYRGHKRTSPDYSALDMSTGGFGKEAVERLAGLLAEVGYEFVPRPHRGGSGRLFWYLRSQGESARRFLEAVAPYLPACLRHKLPPAMRDRIPFQSELWSLGAPVRFNDEVQVMQGQPRNGHWAYCIDVEETENFIAGGMILHNCHWRTGVHRVNGTWFAGPGAVARTNRSESEMKRRPAALILTLGDPGAQDGIGFEEIPLKSVRPVEEVFVWQEEKAGDDGSLFAGYVAALETGMNLEGLSVEEAVRAAEQKVPPDVMALTREYLSRAGL